MERFAFLSHPLGAAGLNRAFLWTRCLPNYLVRNLFKNISWFKLKPVSPAGFPSGWLIIPPAKADDFLKLSKGRAALRALQAGLRAKKLGARVFGCGVYNSIGSDLAADIRAKLSMPIVTGEAYSVASAIEGLKFACSAKGLDISSLTAAVVGACEPVGSVFAELLARETRALCLIGDSEQKISRTANKILYDTGTVASVNPSLSSAFIKADIIIISPYYQGFEKVLDHLKADCIVCDISRERFALNQISAIRDDITLIEGGAVQFPEQIQVSMSMIDNFQDFSPALGETIIMAMERQNELYLDAELSLLKVNKIFKLAQKNGFKVTGFKSYRQESTFSIGKGMAGIKG